MKIKKLLFTIAAPLLLFTNSSCKKDSTPGNNIGDYYIKANLNGQLTEYRINAEGRVDNSGLRGSAFSTSSSNFPSFNFDIATSLLEVKTYSEVNSTLIFRYNLSGFENFNSNMGNEMDFKITITELTGEIIRGTFEGTIRKAQNFIESISINNGEFRLKRVF
jgi:hypothetical protein